MFKKTLIALAAAATLATGTLATTSSAQAFYVVHHNHHWGHGWGPGWGYGYGYGYGGCFWKSHKVWTPYGPEIVSKKVCY